MGFEISFNENGLTISIGWLWFGLIVSIICFIIAFNIIRANRIKRKMVLKKITTNFGFGDAEFEIDSSARQIAYEVYVELKTRKIGLPIDLDNDVIVEVYNSWYEAFKIIRDALKRIPVSAIDIRLVNEVEKVLNRGLREHLTKWQARFRKWYEDAIKVSEEDPQIVQKEYPLFKDLSEDLLKTNKLLIEFSEGLKKLSLGDE